MLLMVSKSPLRLKLMFSCSGKMYPVGMVFISSMILVKFNCAEEDFCNDKLSSIIFSSKAYRGLFFKICGMLLLQEALMMEHHA